MKREMTHGDFEALFVAYYERLFFFVHTIIDDEDDCRDLLSDTFEELWAKRKAVDTATVKAFLYTVARNKALNLLRHRNTRTQYIEYVRQATQPYTDTDELAAREERDRLIEEAIRMLKPPADQIVRLRLADDRKYKDISQELGISLSMVKKSMGMAIRFIRDYINKKS